MFHATSSSPYFASVSGRSEDDSGPYRLAVRSHDPQNERGDVPSSAVPLVPGAPPITARLEYADDVDWYSFSATEGDLILVKMVWPQDEFFGPDLQILEENGTTLLSFFFPRITSRGAFQAFQAPRTGTFLIEAWNNAGESHEYDLSVSSPIADDHNVWSPPTPLAVDGAAVEGEVTFWGDADYFAVDLAAGQRVIVEVVPLEEGHDTEVYIINPSGFEVASDDDGGGSFAPRLPFTAPSAGRYLVRVRTSFFAAGHERYTIAVRTP